MKKILVRDFIQDRLYHPSAGYFTKHLQLGELKQPIDFKNLIGYEDYIQAVHSNYPQYKWLTPSEVFRPYYGITLGNYIHQQYLFTRKQKLRIVEVGAGYGAACEGVLYYFRNYCPQLFSQLEYHLVDISPMACEGAEQRLSKEFSAQLKKGNLRIFNQNILDYKQSNTKNDLWFFLFLEVFDNLPHDKVINGKQIVVSDMQEIEEEMNDQLIKDTYNYYQEFQQLYPDQDQKDQFLMSTIRSFIQRYYGRENQNAIFLPTVSLQVLRHIRKYYQSPSLIIADFDLLKNPFTQSAVNSPIVSRKLKEAHEKEDFQSYLVERGQADIFFPTNFKFLEFMIKQELKLDSKIFKAYQFADQFSKSVWTTTKSGYNPLKEDFGNTSILVNDHS